MKLRRLTISNFRNIEEATLFFDGHTLLVGMNNVGKSTICEAMDIVLGPDRLSKSPSINEYDFYNASYLDSDGTTPKPLRVEVVLTDLSSTIINSFGSHLEFWDTEEKRLLAEEEIDRTDNPNVNPCLRIETIGRYDIDDDEFEAKTFFSHSPDQVDGSLREVGKGSKRKIGFLYLRALRTGARALSLERGSLLDIILRLENIRTGLWEGSIQRLKNLDPPIGAGATNLRLVLDAIEKRLAQYVPLQSQASSSNLFVSQLTREHLRKTISFFLATTADQEPVPFQEVGMGTLNALVLTLLSFIAEIKEDVIFAMEEPEIALPPHTQRRIADYLLSNTTQCFVTSHSPYIVERFEPEQVQILRRSETAVLTAQPVILDDTIRPKTYRKHMRRGLGEAMLGKAVIVTEGLTEQVGLWSVAEKLEAADENNYPLDLSGVTVFSADGDGSLLGFGRFFKNLGLTTYAFYDRKNRSEDDIRKLQDAFDYPFETSYPGAEALLVAEIPADKQWKLLSEIRASEPRVDSHIPEEKPDDEAIKELCISILKSRKGDGTPGRLIELCDNSELPPSLTSFLSRVYSDFSRPEPVSLSEALEESLVNKLEEDASKAVVTEELV